MPESNARWQIWEGRSPPVFIRRAAGSASKIDPGKCHFIPDQSNKMDGRLYRVELRIPTMTAMGPKPDPSPAPACLLSPGCGHGAASALGSDVHMRTNAPQ
jgi:hypothetical protein